MSNWEYGFIYHVVNIKPINTIIDSCVFHTFIYHVVNIKPKIKSIINH